MNKFKEIKPEDLNKSTFKLIGKDWMLVTAQSNNKVNTMAASWGGFGVMFNKNDILYRKSNKYTNICMNLVRKL